MKALEQFEVVDFGSLQNNMESGFAILHDFPPPDVEEAWRRCLSRVEIPAHYNTPEFFLERHWIGSRHFAVLALNRGSVVGVLTGRHDENEVLSGLRSRPQICVDRTADVKSAIASLARGLLAEAGSAQLVTAYSWSSLPLEPFEEMGFRRREFEGDLVLDLANGSEALFKEFHASRRKNIRYAIKNGVEVSQAENLGDIEILYQIHMRWRKTQRKTISTGQIPWDVFERRFQHPDNFRFFLARHAGKVIANITLRFCPSGLVEFSDHNSLDEFLHLKPNDLLQWRCIEWACSAGFRFCSLGGAHTFHRRFGGTLVPIVRYRIDRSWLRRHDFQEAAMDSIRGGFRRLPMSAQTFIRHAMERE